MSNPRILDEVRKSWRAHEVYGEYIQVTREFGPYLGFRFRV